MHNITVQILFLNTALNIDNISLNKFSGIYEDVPAISTMNNTTQKYDIEEIYFAITTNTRLVLNTVHFLKFWAQVPDIKCLIVFEQKDLANNSNITEYLISEGVSCKIQSSNVTDYYIRYYELFQTLWNSEIINNMSTQTEKTQWFAIGDDDTVWFINNLLRTVQQYNSSDRIYLGGVSNKTRQLQRRGDFFAYGGGGIILSRPLALLFAEHTETCKRLTGRYGDMVEME